MLVRARAVDLHFNVNVYTGRDGVIRSGRSHGARWPSSSIGTCA
jgi:citrate lyase alpha subunit